MTIQYILTDMTFMESATEKLNVTNAGFGFGLGSKKLKLN